MDDLRLFLAIASCGYACLIFVWLRQYGVKRGLLVGFFRLLWMLPILLSAFPAIEKQTFSKAVSLKNLHVLFDDSESMKKDSAEKIAKSVVNDLESKCVKVGCRLDLTYLSELSDEVKKGYTPLHTAIKSWLPLNYGEPWIILSDGGDSQPRVPWGLSSRESSKNGLVLSVAQEQDENIWLETVQGADFGFDQKPIELEVVVHRQSKNLAEELTIQIQASEFDRSLIAMNVTFQPKEDTLTVNLPIPPLSKGMHLLKVNALPIGGEKAIWDNSVYKSMEILANTIGVLHLLGSPSWDGRFIRRYLKSEPKYDLISFFILRDPSDAQFSNERDLSLIPFPVERLFNEELPHFRAVIVQNFSLYQFLDPAYQKNLADFVLNGGSLLFIGGPRALKDMDIVSSPLAALLPFKLPEGVKNFSGFGLPTENGFVPYESETKFKIKLANPNKEERTLARVFDEWQDLDFNLIEEGSYQGLHKLAKVEALKQGSTPLLMAQLPDGSESLIAAASYPGKGRALWIFSDSLWRLALQPDKSHSRETHYKFLRSAMTWLLREEMQRPVWLQDFSLLPNEDGTEWSVIVRGPAARFLGEINAWNFKVCGQDVGNKDILKQRITDDHWILRGHLQSRFVSGFACELTASAEHRSFGLAKASIYGIVPEVFSDQEIDGSRHRLENLAQTTGAEFVDLAGEGGNREVYEWFEGSFSKESIQNWAEQKSVLDYYWATRTPWFWFIIVFLPLEVLVRRWDKIVGPVSLGSRRFMKSS